MPLPTKTPDEVLKTMREKYVTGTATNHLQFLIYGASGSGKTYSLRTARKPLWIDSFDPGGSVALADLVADGRAVVVDAYEQEDAKRPSAFAQWDKNFDSLEASGIFEQIGTYVIDSATTWAQSIMNEVLKRASRPGGVPQQNDWYPQMVIMEAAVKRILSLPCDVVFICHDSLLQDAISGKVLRSPLLTGKSKTRIPLLFSEIYYADVKRTPKGDNFIWQTRKDGTSDARSRMAGRPGNNVEVAEPQNFLELAKKFHVPYEDKEPFSI